MADVVDSKTRSRMMAGIRGKDTIPELVVRRALFAAGFRFRLHRRDLPGVPDIVLPGRRVALFVHGCFWHLHTGCRYSKIPATRRDFWREKLAGNVRRDRRAIDDLIALGWRVLIVWECATRDGALLKSLPSVLSEWIAAGDPFGEVSGGGMR